MTSSRVSRPMSRACPAGRGRRGGRRRPGRGRSGRPGRPGRRGRPAARRRSAAWPRGGPRPGRPGGGTTSASISTASGQVLGADPERDARSSRRRASRRRPRSPRPAPRPSGVARPFLEQPAGQVGQARLRLAEQAGVDEQLERHDPGARPALGQISRRPLASVDRGGDGSRPASRPSPGIASAIGRSGAAGDGGRPGSARGAGSRAREQDGHGRARRAAATSRPSGSTSTR